MTNTVNIIIFASLLLNASLSLAQAAEEQVITEEETKQWYQVEIFVFANNDLNAPEDEQWPEQQGLKYPNNLVTLSAPLSSIELNNITSTDLLTDQQNPVVENEPLASTEEQTPPLKAFATLDNAEYQLTEAANKILAQYDFRPLFHKAWRQTINDRDNAISIAITGGEAFDQHFELEGSLTLSLERYLHINTDLWLNQFVNKAAHEQTDWNLLPPVPQHMGEEDASEKIIDFNSRADNSRADFTVDFSVDNVDINSGELIGQVIRDKQVTEPATGKPLQMAPITDPLEGVNERLELQLQLLNDSQYRVERTVVLRQHRRMRSKEIHYIDHPLFAVLLRIDPYQYQPVDVDDAISE